MFGGIVRRLGRVARVEPRPGGCRLVLEDAPEAREPGASVAVNGVCLTVVAPAAFDVVAETLRRTNLGGLRAGDPVNLEPSLRAGDPIDGHFVQGHVDGVGKVARKSGSGHDVEMEVELAPELASQIVEKGSVAVDGVSLTVVRAERDQFTVALIPYTLEQTTLGRKGLGDPVNIEVDILGKYVRRFLSTAGERCDPASWPGIASEPAAGGPGGATPR